MVNRQRGEVSLEINGEAMILRPTFQAIAAIEGETGKGFIALAHTMRSGEMKVNELAAVLFYGLHAGGGDNSLSRSEVEEVIALHMAKCVGAAAAFVKQALGHE